MTDDEPHRRMDAARVRAELTVQDLWLRYIALGGSGDAFDLDGHLQGLMPLDDFQQTVLAQTLNEALQDSYEAYYIPLPGPPSSQIADDERLLQLIDQLLNHQPPAARTEQ